MKLEVYNNNRKAGNVILTSCVMCAVYLGSWLTDLV